LVSAGWEAGYAVHGPLLGPDPGILDRLPMPLGSVAVSAGALGEAWLADRNAVVHALQAVGRLAVLAGVAGGRSDAAGTAWDASTAEMCTAGTGGPAFWATA